MRLAQTEFEIAQEDHLRADLYNYLGLMLTAPPDELLLTQTAGLSGDTAQRAPVGETVCGGGCTRHR